MSDLEAWQIGSAGPPAVCLCCGSKFDDGEHKIMGPYLDGPYIWVCKWCHDKPFLYFSDKTQWDADGKGNTSLDMPGNR